MLTIQSRFFVARISGWEVTDFLLDCTDDRYQQWWPGTHLELHALTRGRDHVGDVVLMDEYIGKRRVRIEAATRNGDLGAIAAPVDFLGVNYYTPVVMDGQERPVQPHPISAAGWQQIYPQGLHDVLVRLRRDYPSPEVLITENGVPDDVSDNGQPTADRTRVDFLRQHLRAVHQTIGEGSRVTGYHAWSLLDNFEWAAGYSQRWGLVQVDFNTLARSPKSSASWYSAVARNNSIPGD